MKRIANIFSEIAMLVCLLCCNPALGQQKTTVAENSFESAFQFKTNLRKLCEDHIMWTRIVILCVVDDVAGKEQAIKRLLQNQVDIGNAIKPYYEKRRVKN